MEAATDTYVQEMWYHDSVAEMAEYWGESEAYIRDMLLEEQAWTAMVREEREAEQAAYISTLPR